MNELDEAVKKIRKTIYKEDTSPHEAAYLLNKLSAIVGSFREICLDKEMIYNTELAEIMLTEKTVTLAKIKSKTLDSYREYRSTENQIETVLDMMRSLKYTIKTGMTEHKEANY